jgi:hypothetical protein
MDEPEVREHIRRAYVSLRASYDQLGGWRFPGYLDDADQSYVGPWAWSEGDIQRHFANALSAEFPPEWVHLEMPLRIGTRQDLEPPGPGKRATTTHIDIVVSDLSGLPNDLRHASPDEVRAASLGFRGRTHEAFIEVKWFHKGSPKWDAHNWNAKVVPGVPPDMKRLAGHRRAGRCLAAAMLVVDDTGAYAGRLNPLHLELPPLSEVDLLVLHGPLEGGGETGADDSAFWAEMGEDDGDV